MPNVTMPNGDVVSMPDNPTPEQIGGLKKIAAKQAFDIGLKQPQKSYPSLGDIQKANAEGRVEGVTPEQQQKLGTAGTGEKLGLNFGAGASKALTGMSQSISGEDENPNDAVARRNKEAVLAKSLPYAGKAAQIGGGMAMTAPTMAIPGGPVVGGLLGGAAQSLAEPASSPQERLTNMGVGGATGGGVGAVASGLGRAATAVRNNILPSGTAASTARKAVEESDIPEVVSDALRANKGVTPSGTMPTASQASGNVGIQGLEKASRGREATSAAWNTADEAANNARVAALRDATGGNTADAAIAAKAARDSTTKPLLQSAVGYADHAQPTGFQTQASQALGPVKAATDEGRAVLNDVRSQISNTRNLDADALHGIRTRLADVESSDPGIGDAKKAVDNLLDTASGGRYGTYLQNFINKSRDVNAAEAAQRVKGVHLQDLPNAQEFPVGVPMGQDPKISGKDLTTALRKEAAGPHGSQLAPEVEDKIGKIATEEGQASAYKNVASAAPLPKSVGREVVGAAAGPAMGGTAGFLLGGPPGALLGAAIPAGAMAGKRALERKTQEHLANLLRNPAALADAMDKAGIPISGDNPLTRVLRQGATQSVLDRSK
jgi:hypothetical protein